MQIPCGVYPEMPTEGVVSGDPAGIGDGLPQFGGAVGMPGRRGAFDARSRAHVVERAAEVFGIERDGIHPGQECDSYRASLGRPTKEFCGPAFLGSGVLGVDGWQKRGCRASIHPRPGKRR
jgi:hypothetical protein